MTIHTRFALTTLAAALLAACSTMPPENAMLNQARSDYRAAQDNEQTRNLAGGELKFAEDSLNRANNAWKQGDKRDEVEHLAYLAKQRVAIAEETARQKSAEQAVANATAARDKVRLDARTQEADHAQHRADSARRQADESQRQADRSQRNADESQRQSEASWRAADEAQARNRVLEAQLADLNAKQTERGLVITIGDVFFDTDQARLRAGGLRSVEKLVGFLNENPQRTALVEGFTDSTGSDSHNQTLSSRRADAVRFALVEMGIGRERISSQGYGEAFPVASNDSEGNRQLNRRVEIIVSGENGTIPPR